MRGAADGRGKGWPARPMIRRSGHGAVSSSMSYPGTALGLR
jgi:hypothetical protein